MSVTLTFGHFDRHLSGFHSGISDVFVTLLGLFFMSRYRETVIINSEPELHWVGRDTEGDVFADIVTHSLHTKVKSIQDDVTPNFNRRLRKGEFLPINTTVIKTLEHIVVPATVSSEYPGSLPNQPKSYSGSIDIRGLVPHPRFSTYTPDPDDIDDVVINALSKAKSPEFDVLTFLGELRETNALLEKNGNRIRSLVNGTAYRAFKREVARARRGKRTYNARRALEDFNSLWLEGRYGWRPLIYSMESALKALSKKYSSELMVSSHSKTVDIDETLEDYFISYTGEDFTTSSERKGTCTLRAKVYYRSSMSAWGFNPVVTAYELTRFSFVWDWFTNTGKWLNAITPRVGYDQVGICVSTKLDLLDTYSTVCRGNSGWVLYDANPQETIRLLQYHRTPYTGFPLPSFQLNLSPAKIVDLVALAFSLNSDITKRLKL